MRGGAGGDVYLPCLAYLLTARTRTDYNKPGKTKNEQLKQPDTAQEMNLEKVELELDQMEQASGGLDNGNSEGRRNNQSDHQIVV